MQLQLTPLCKRKPIHFNFKFGTAEILQECMKEVENIEAILKAYPKVKVKIGGYTDKAGDEAANKKPF